MPSNSRRLPALRPRAKLSTSAFPLSNAHLLPVIRRVHLSCPPNAAQLQGQHSKRKAYPQPPGKTPRAALWALIAGAASSLQSLSWTFTAPCAAFRHRPVPTFDPLPGLLSPAGQPNPKSDFPAPPQGLSTMTWELNRRHWLRAINSRFIYGRIVSCACCPSSPLSSHGSLATIAGFDPNPTHPLAQPHLLPVARCCVLPRCNNR